MFQFSPDTWKVSVVNSTVSQAGNVLTASYHHHHHHSRGSCLDIAERQALPDDLAIGTEIFTTLETLVAIGCHSSLLNG